MVAETTSPAQTAQAGQAVRVMVKQSRLPLMVAVFLIGLVIPLILNAGGVRLSVYRIVLLILFIPALFKLLSGSAGRIRVSDIAVFVICIWSCLSIFVVQGLLIETMGILVVETLGSYMIARCYIRTPDTFRATVKLLFVLVLIICPFAIFESVTGRYLILEVFNKFGTVYPSGGFEKRMGLDRAQGPFAHPIHFGLFVGALIGLVYYVLGHGKSFFSGLWRTAIVAATGALALSSGPLTALMAQIYILIWDRTLFKVKARWYILAALTVLAYIVVDVLSNRNPFQVFISYMAFNAHTAYNRIWIWIYGTAAIFKNPLWGMGLTDNWARPYWMSPSADMFWILPAMRHGIVVWAAYFTFLLSITVPLAFRKLGPRLSDYRLGYLTSVAGLFMAGWTVHYWDAVFAFFMFILGSGVWMLDYKEAELIKEETDAAPIHRGNPYSRFPVKPVRRNLTPHINTAKDARKARTYARPPVPELKRQGRATTPKTRDPK